MIDLKHDAFLKALNTDEVRHSGRSLYTHLVGTHDLLQAWGNPEPVCTAGLFHSIYGTRFFKYATWPLDDRETIQLLIGPEAEMLAYLFCTSNRPLAFFSDTLDLADLNPALREIEAANLIEQGSRSRWLERLRNSRISDAARHAIDQYVGQIERAT